MVNLSSIYHLRISPAEGVLIITDTASQCLFIKSPRSILDTLSNPYFYIFFEVPKFMFEYHKYGAVSDTVFVYCQKYPLRTMFLENSIEEGKS